MDKNSTIEKFQSALENNFDKVNKYQDVHLIHLSSINSLIKENIACLQLGLNTASITLTNHIFENGFKTALKLNHIPFINVDNDEFNAKSVEAHDLFDNKKLHNLLQQYAKVMGITKEKENFLISLKDDFRNPYSHAEKEFLLKNKPTEIKILSFKINDALEANEKNLEIPFEEKLISNKSVFISQEISNMNSDKNALFYFDQIINFLLELEVHLINSSKE